MSTRSGQLGLAAVEFAIIGALTLVVLFAVIEVGRAVFALNTLNETTRRAARVATVCPVNDPAIREVALFNAPGGGTGSRILRGLDPSNIAVEYLDRNGDVVADPVADFLQIRYVRARIINYQHRMLIPFRDYIFSAPDFATTLRRESLGVPRQGAIQPC